MRRYLHASRERAGQSCAFPGLVVVGGVPVAEVVGRRDWVTALGVGPGGIAKRGYVSSCGWRQRVLGRRVTD